MLKAPIEKVNSSPADTELVETDELDDELALLDESAEADELDEDKLADELLELIELPDELKGIELDDEPAEADELKDDVILLVVPLLSSFLLESVGQFMKKIKNNINIMLIKIIFFFTISPIL